MSVSEVRTQIYLERDQHRALKTAARLRGVSMAQVVREAVAEYLRRLKREPGEGTVFAEDAIWSLPELADDFPGTGRPDASRRHDELLYGESEE